MSLIYKKESSTYFYLLLLFLVVKAVILLSIIGSEVISLAPDEAQYWTWSQEVDFGYFSKPPGIAWQIFSTTSLLGNTELGVRFGAVIIGFLLSIAVFMTARSCQLSYKHSFWSAICMAVSPLGVYLSFATVSDGGSILFLVLAIWATLRKETPDYLLAGFFILLGALFKWTAFLFWPFLLLFACFEKKFRKPSLILGILLSLLALVPVLYWNATHEWATFRHVGKTTLQAKGGNFFGFLASQIGLISPVYFVLLFLSFLYLLNRGTKKIYFCALFPAALIVYFGLSFFKKIQPNWGAYLYPPGMILIAWICLEKRWKLWLHLGTWISIVLIASAFSFPYVNKKTDWIPYSLNPFRQSLGWNHLPEILNQIGFNPKTEFLFGDKYQTASLLSFYNSAQKRAYFFNISETRKNQFSYWPQMEEKEKGKDGYFFALDHAKPSDIAWYRNHYLKRLSPYFQKVQFIGAYPLLISKGEPVKYAFIFKGTNYLGNRPDLNKDFGY